MAGARAALQRAVPPVPAVGAEAGAVAAHPVRGAARVAQLDLAPFARPARLAGAAAARAVAVRPARQVAHLCRSGSVLASQ